MGHKLLRRVLPRTARDARFASDGRTATRRGRRPLSPAQLQADRDHLIAMFVD